MKPKTLDELIDYMNESKCGWKTQCELLIDFAENLEFDNKRLKQAILNCKRNGGTICSHTIGIKEILEGKK